MDAIRSSYRHVEVELLLAETLKHLADGREFYLHAARSVVDREIRSAFGFAAETYANLLDTLRIAIPAREQPELPGRAPSLYATVAGNFDGRDPQPSAAALHALDFSLLHRMEALFANYPNMHVRSALKKHVLGVQRVCDQSRRLALRHVA